MIKMSIPAALHTEGTAQVSDWSTISDTANKLCSGKSNSGIAEVITTKLQAADVFFGQKYVFSDFESINSFIHVFIYN